MKIKSQIELESNNESSTQARALASQNKSLKNIVPLLVEEYIQKRGLYKIKGEIICGNESYTQKTADILNI